jgi:hypothetical protein
MTRAALTDLVKLKMDEVSPFSTGEIVPDANIDGFLDGAADEILLKMPLQILNPTKLPSGGLTSNGDGTGQIPVPSDYLRLHHFRMGEWRRDVVKTITISDPKYKLQQYTTTRGKPSRPVVVDMTITISASLYRVLRFFSVVSSYSLDSAAYIKTLGAAFTTFPDNIASPMAYQVAGNIFLSQNRGDAAQAAFVKVNEFINLYQ